MNQTQHFENLLQVERKSVHLLRALGLPQCKESPLPITSIKAELSEIEEDMDALISQLSFLSINEGHVVPLTHQIFSGDVMENLSCQVLIKFLQTSSVSTEDTVGSLKWYVSSMIALKSHLKYESFQENPL